MRFALITTGGLAASPQVPVPHHLACPKQPLHLRVATLGVTYTVRSGRVGSTTKAASSHSSGPVPAVPQALSIYPCLLMRSLAAWIPTISFFSLLKCLSLLIFAQFFSSHLSVLGKRAPGCLRKTIFLLPLCSQILPCSFHSVLSILYLYPRCHPQACEGSALPWHGCLPARWCCFSFVSLWKFYKGWPMASLLLSSSHTLPLRWHCGFHPSLHWHHFSKVASSSESLPLPSLCRPWPLQPLRLFSSFWRAVTCISMTLNPPSFSAFSTGASCSFGEWGLHAAFSLPLLMGAHLFLGLASAGNPLTALGLIFLCLQTSISQGHRLPAGHLELNILFYLILLA